MTVTESVPEMTQTENCVEIKVELRPVKLSAAALIRVTLHAHRARGLVSVELEGHFCPMTAKRLGAALCNASGFVFDDCIRSHVPMEEGARTCAENISSVLHALVETCCLAYGDENGWALRPMAHGGSA